MSTESAKSSDSQRPIVDAQPSDPLSEVLLCGAVFATSLCVYLLTLAPTVALGDSPELAVAAHRLGIAHPTGYPLYTLLGHLWLNLLPVGDVAWGMNLFSALAGAAGMAVFASFLLRFTQSALGAWAGAISFAFTPLFWAQCTLTEVYSLHVFLLAVVVYRRLPLGQVRIGLRGFVAVGAVQGFLSAMFGGAGPFGAVFMLNYGLVRNAFVGTMAVATLGISAAKLPVYGGYALLDRRALVIAVILGAIMMVGALIGGAIARRVSDRFFVVAIEVLIAFGGVVLLIQA